MAYNREQENAAAADLIRSRLAQRQNVDGEIRSLLEDSTKRMQTLAGRGAPKNSTEAAVMRNAANNALSDFQNSSARLRSLLEQDRGLSDGDYTNQALEALNQRERQLRSASRQTLPDVSGALKLGAQALAASAANGGSKSKLVEWQTRPYMSAAEEADYNGLTAAQIRLNQLQNAHNTNVDLSQNPVAQRDAAWKNYQELEKQAAQVQRQINELLQAKKKAERQNQISQMEAVKANSDFLQTAQQGAQGTPTYEQLQQQYSSGYEAGRAGAVDNTVYFDWLNRESHPNTAKFASQLSKSQMDTYNYYYARYGKQKADEYLELLQPELSEKSFEESVQKINNEMPVPCHPAGAYRHVRSLCLGGKRGQCGARGGHRRQPGGCSAHTAGRLRPAENSGKCRRYGTVFWERFVFHGKYGDKAALWPGGWSWPTPCRPAY